ncbi:uncharacterized protein LOC124163684 [Ischnura elegans]|uniref:uncharacterized protein LOC124163684 n=1 Tax=Ischnura elegans TaxID=197161 RepID=UPI001ED8B747|nr:uncharacterized protein LOC124163684 [Ischnura elegans]
MDDSASQPKEVEEPPCVAVRVELQSPVTTYRAPLPYVPVIMQAKGYQRATVVVDDASSTREAPQVGLKGTSDEAFEKRSHGGGDELRSDRKSGETENQQNGQMPFQKLNRSKSSDHLKTRATLPKTFASSREDYACDDSIRERRRNRLEEIIKRSKERTSNAQNNELFIRETSNPVRPATMEHGKKVSLDHAEKNGISVETSDDLGKSGEESKSSIHQLNGHRRTGSHQEIVDRQRIQNSWILPLDQDFSWNKTVNSVHKMISNYEKTACDLRKKNVVSNTMPGTRRLTKAPRVPVTTLAARFQNGPNE